MTDSMIERVARAIWQTMNSIMHDHDNLWQKNKQKIIYRDSARAAIAAMREPTEQVRNTMNAHASNGMVNWDDYHAAMIDAALKEKP